LSAGRGNGAGNLSATLDKLWFWEKKLYQEIKVHNRTHTVTWGLAYSRRKIRKAQEHGEAEEAPGGKAAAN
jgi:hypothetical protein